jgi:hypothetical protein
MEILYNNIVAAKQTLYLTVNFTRTICTSRCFFLTTEGLSKRNVHEWSAPTCCIEREVYGANENLLMNTAMITMILLQLKGSFPKFWETAWRCHVRAAWPTKQLGLCWYLQISFIKRPVFQSVEILEWTALRVTRLALACYRLLEKHFHTSQMYISLMMTCRRRTLSIHRGSQSRHPVFEF